MKNACWSRNVLKDAVLDNSCSDGGRLFQAAKAAYRKKQNFSRFRGYSYRLLYQTEVVIV